MTYSFSYLEQVCCSMSSSDCCYLPRYSEFIDCINYRYFPGGSGSTMSTGSAGDPGWIPGLGRSPGENKLPTPVFLNFTYFSACKESACNAGNLGSIRGLGRSSGEGKGYPLQYSGLQNSRGQILHGVAKRQTRLSDFHFTHHLSDFS